GWRVADFYPADSGRTGWGTVELRRPNPNLHTSQHTSQLRNPSGLSVRGAPNNNLMPRAVVSNSMKPPSLTQVAGPGIGIAGVQVLATLAAQRWDAILETRRHYAFWRAARNGDVGIFAPHGTYSVGEPGHEVRAAYLDWLCLHRALEQGSG